MFFQKLLIITFCSVVCPQNIEVRDAYQMNIRNGDATKEYNSYPEPAYAGYTFDVTKMKSRRNFVSILIGQPREGDVNKTTSTGKIINCKVDFDAAGSKEETTPSVNETTRYLNESTQTPATTGVPVRSTYVEANCSIEKIFDSTDRTQIGAFHEYTSDALGLTLGNIGDSGNYAICAQGRQKECPGANNAASSPGACYFGNPETESWKFLQRNESKCFDKTIDIIFVVDGSQSIGPTNFQAVRNWLAEATRSLEEMYGDAVRTEVLQYSYKPPDYLGIPITNSDNFVIPYNLNEALSIAEINRRIQDMKYLSSSTYTYYGLRRATEVEFIRSTQYPNSLRVVVVLTDGRANDVANLMPWWDKYGATKWLIPFAIGVGDYESFRNQLNTIANGDTSKERVWGVGTFDKLPDLLSDLTKSIATAVVPEGQPVNQATTFDERAASSTNSRQMGSSITSLKDGSIHFGSVGMYLDSGSVMRYGSQSDTYPVVPSYTTIQRALPNTTTDSYLGYTTTSGYFDGESQGQYIAAGAPRYRLKGAVVLYKTVNSSAYMKDSFTIFPPSDTRDQVAAYFGGCLMSVDVSGDGVDDLFVASPLFVGENYDEGRVSVYIGDGSDSVTKWTQRSFSPIALFGDKSHGARFGSAMAAADDLNLDGFQDVIIGAPTADGGSGAVFIYHGMRGGISSEYTQRIQASSLTGATLQYFGQSLQGGIDVDDNGYPDIFVGSPKTDSIVMLKSRPIARLSSTLQFLNSTIDFFACVFTNGYKNCATLEVCFSANGTSVEENITIVYNLTLDPTLSPGGRAVFNYSPVKTISMILPIPKETWRCFTYSLDILTNATDFNTPIEAKVEFGLSESHTSLPMSSITDPTSENTNVGTIGWEKDCVNGVCVPDLFVNVQTTLPKAEESLSSTIVISRSTENKPVTMTVSFGNEGENSFYTKLRMTYPANASISAIRSATPSSTNCVQEDGSPTITKERAIQLYKYTGGEIVKSSKSLCSFALDASLDNLREESSLDNFNVTFTAFSDSSTSVENASTLHDNTWEISIPIKYQSDYTVRSDIGDTVIIFNSTEHNTTDIKSIAQIGVNTSDVEVDIRITSNGYSNIPLAEVTFMYPWLIDDTFPILYLYKLECPTHNGKARCTCSTSFVDKYNLLNNVSDQNAGQTGSGEGETAAPSMEAFLDQDMICPKTNTSSNYSCAVIPCTISDLYSSGEVHFKASFRLWTRSLDGMFDNENITSLAIRSGFRISIEKSPQIIAMDGKMVPAKEQEVVVIATKFVKEVVVVTQDDSFLYLALGIAGGVLFLALVAFVLWKCDFFKNQYQRNQELEDETNFTDEEKAASKGQYVVDEQDKIESTGAVRYSIAISSSEIPTTKSNGIENTNHIYDNDALVTTTEEANLIYANDAVVTTTEEANLMYANDAVVTTTEEANLIYANDAIVTTAEEASAIQALQDATDVNDSEPDYDEPPDDVEGAYDDDDNNTQDISMHSTEQTVTSDNNDDEPDLDSLPDEDLPPPPSV